MNKNSQEPTDQVREEVVPEPEILEEPVDGEGCVPHLVDEYAVDKTIRHAVYAAMGIGVLPLPLVNVAAVTAGDLIMVRKLAGLYGVDFREGMVKKIITSVIGAGTGVLAAGLLETVVSGIPLIGLPLTIGSKPVMNGLTTYALGRMFVAHFERGGNFVRVNLDVMKENFASAFERSREWLGDTIKGKGAQAAQA